MSDFTKLPREIADCMNRAGATLSEDQFMLLNGYLATVQQKAEAEEASELIDLCEMLAQWHELNRKLTDSQARIDALHESFQNKERKADQAREATNNTDERNYWLGVRSAYRDAAREVKAEKRDISND